MMEGQPIKFRMLELFNEKDSRRSTTSRETTAEE